MFGELLKIRKIFIFIFAIIFTKQDNKDWVAALIEFTIVLKWFFSISINIITETHIAINNYIIYMDSMGYTKGTSRIALSYGRQREGLVCVGGVCRVVPTSNGSTLTISSNF